MISSPLSPPGWYADPSGRHLYRWWDGSVWTDRVGDGSVEQHDSIGATPQPHAAPSTPAAIWGSPPAKKPTSGWPVAAIVVGLVGFLGIVLVVGLVVLAGSSGSVVDENFDRGTGPFSTDSDNTVDLEFAQGGYRVTVKDATGPQEARTFFEPSRRAVRVESDVTIATSPGAVGTGLSCYNGPTGYLFVVGTDGKAFIAKVNDQPTGDVEALGQGTASLGSTTHRLSLECTGGGTGATTVSGSIDGTTVVTATDDQGYDQFQAAGFWVSAAKAPSVVLFDNLRVTQL